jgi:hypothetical protein
MSEPVLVGELLPGVLQEVIDRAGLGYERWAEQVAATGYCTHPVRLRGTVEHADPATGEVRTVYSTDQEPDATLLKGWAADQASNPGDSRRATTCARVAGSRPGRSSGCSDRSDGGGSAAQIWLRVAWLTATPLPKGVPRGASATRPHGTTGTWAATSVVLADAWDRSNAGHRGIRGADQQKRGVSVVCLSGCQFVCGLRPGVGSRPPGIYPSIL